MRAAEFLFDLCARQFFVVEWIYGSENVADVFTKAQPVLLCFTTTWMHMHD